MMTNDFIAVTEWVRGYLGCFKYEANQKVIDEIVEIVLEGYQVKSYKRIENQKEHLQRLKNKKENMEKEIKRIEDNIKEKGK